MPETPSRTKQLADYQRQYRDLAAQLAQIGFIATGTLIQRSTRCATPGCACHADPPRLHGPYHQWTTKIAGKTLTRRLTDRQATHYREWIDNNRQLRELAAQMRQISARAAELILATDTPEGG